MRLYIYYNKLDSTKEPHGKIEAINLGEAILIAAQVKDMNIQDFLTIFRVEEYERRKI